MKILAISGSARFNSTNTAMLRAVRTLAPSELEISIFDGVGRLPVFSPDLEGEHLPAAVRDFTKIVAENDGLIIASPEYIRSIPGSLKNAIHWLVSGEQIISKPIALIHASHRGDDMLAGLRTVLSTVTHRFAPESRAKVEAYFRCFQTISRQNARPLRRRFEFRRGKLNMRSATLHFATFQVPWLSVASFCPVVFSQSHTARTSSQAMFSGVATR